MSQTGDCTTIQEADLLSSGGVSQLTGVTFLGGLNFTLRCSTGGTATITYALSEQVDAARLRVYKYATATGTLTDITSRIAITSNGGIPTISYSLTDGGNYDEDGVANGHIVDPLYVGLGQSASANGGLAETGEGRYRPRLIGVALMILGLIGSYLVLYNDKYKLPTRS